MSLAETLKKRAAAMKSGKAASKSVSKAEPKKAVAKKSNGNGKTPTPRAESKTAKILDLLKNGSSREKIRARFDMEKESDVSWYISKFKAKGLLPKSFEPKE